MTSIRAVLLGWTELKAQLQRVQREQEVREGRDGEYRQRFSQSTPNYT